MNIIEKVKSLHLPSGEYVVIGSGILDVLGIRPSVDIDIAVTNKLHKQLRESGEWNESERYNKIFLDKDVFEITPQLDWDEYKTTTEEAISSAKIIEGVYFLNLEELCKFKKAFGREKDFRDIKLIEEYLNKQK